MEYTVKLNEHQVELLKSILDQIEPMQLIVAPATKPKKLSSTEQTLQKIRDYRANKARKKNNNNNS